MKVTMNYFKEWMIRNYGQATWEAFKINWENEENSWSKKYREKISDFFKSVPSYSFISSAFPLKHYSPRWKKIDFAWCEQLDIDIDRETEDQEELKIRLTTKEKYSEK